MGEAAVEANPDTHTRKAVAGHGQQATQNPDRSYCGGYVAGTQHGGAQILFRFMIEAYKSHDWQVAPAVVVSVEKRQLLCPVGWVVGRVKVEGDEAGASTQPLGMAFHPLSASVSPRR